MICYDTLCDEAPLDVGHDDKKERGLGSASPLVRAPFGGPPTSAACSHVITSACTSMLLQHTALALVRGNTTYEPLQSAPIQE